MENIDDFMLYGDINKSKFDWMVEQIINICEKHKLMPMTARYYVNRHDNSIAFITSVKSENAEELSNLDFELALKRSENDHFLKNGITGWFSGI